VVIKINVGLLWFLYPHFLTAEEKNTVKTKFLSSQVRTEGFSVLIHSNYTRLSVVHFKVQS